jgi:hypothetical protein
MPRLCQPLWHQGGIQDNFSTLVEVEDENSAAAMSPVLNFLLRMKQAGIATILIHHANKVGKAFRGSTKLAATFEVILGLTETDEAVLSQSLAFKIDWQQYRGKRNDATIPMKVQLQGREIHEATRVHEAAEDIQMQKTEKTLIMLRTCEYATGAELAGGLEITPVKLSRLKAKIIAAELISKSQWTGCLNSARENRRYSPRMTA